MFCRRWPPRSCEAPSAKLATTDQGSARREGPLRMPYVSAPHLWDPGRAMPGSTLEASWCSREQALSRDGWLKQLRVAGADGRSVEVALASAVSVDGLQHAGSAMLRAARSHVLVGIAGRLIDALRGRG